MNDISGVKTAMPSRLLVAGCTVVIFLVSGCVPEESGIEPDMHKVRTHHSSSTALRYTYIIVNAFSHDTSAFTQGLVWDSGTLYEGTGLYRHSVLRRTNLESGEVLQQVRLPDQYFGEGITIFRDRIIQLSWRSKTGFVYDKNSFHLIGTFHYDHEGWGITHDGQRLIMSDGSSYLYFRDPDTYKEIGKIEVHDQNAPITRLNELEYIDGRIFANVWRTDSIAIIDPSNGQVQAWIELRGLTDRAGGDRTEKTLNGIAYDKEHDRLFVTGKLWPEIYEIQLVPRNTEIHKN